MVFKYEYTINGNIIPAGNIIAHTYSSKYNSPTVVEIEVPTSFLTTYSVDNGVAVLVQYGSTLATENYLFRGTVESIKQVGSSVILICYDKLYQLKLRTINEVYNLSSDTAGNIRSILIDMIQTFGGLSASITSIESTSAYPLKEKFFSFNSTVFDKVLELCEVVLYVFYYDSDKDKVYAHQKGYYNNTDNFQTGLNIVGKPQWNFDSKNIINYLILYGSNIGVSTIEFFNGTGAEDTFALDYPPDPSINVKVEIYDGFDWNEQLYGRDGTTEPGTFNYTIDYDQTIKSIIFKDDTTPTSIPVVGTDNIKITYSYVDVLVTTRTNDSSRTAYPTSDGGYRERHITNTAITTSEDLENIADSIITYFGDTYDSVNFMCTKVTDIPKVGRLCGIKDDMNIQDTSLIINTVSFKYPGDVYNIKMSELYGDPNELVNPISLRIKRLEEVSDDNTYIVRNSITNNIYIEVKQDLIVSEFINIDEIWNKIETWDKTEVWASEPSYDTFSVDNSKWVEV